MTETKGPAVKSGLTLAVVLGFIYTSLVLLPANLFSQLSLGITISGYSAYMTIMLITLVFTRALKKLSKQEVAILYLLADIPAGGVIGILILQSIYTKNISTLTWSFIEPLSKRPLPELIPNWYAPPLNSPSVILRDLLRPDILFPIAFMQIVYLLIFFMDTSLGYLLFRVTEEQELPFPTAQISASAVTTLSEMPKEKMSTVTLAALFAVIYSAVVYIPQVLGFPIIPVPWIDFNSALEKLLPGASFGVATDPISFVAGLVVPFNVALSLFIGSFLVYFVGNCVLVRLHLFTDWALGMSVSLAYQRSVLSYWFYLQLGFGVVVAIVTIAFNLRAVVAAFRRPREIEERTVFSSRNLVIVYVASAVALALLINYFTSFDLLLLVLLLVLWKFIASAMSTLTLGSAGISTSVPYVNNLAIYASGYPKVDIWYVPGLDASTSGGGPAGTVYMFKVAKMTETRPSDLIRGLILAVILSRILSIVFAAVLWKISPIPSTLYRAVDIYWPIGIIMNGIWVTHGIDIYAGAPYLLTGAITGLVLAVLENLFRLSLVSAAGFLAGILTPIPSAFSLFIASLISRILRANPGTSVSWENHKMDIAVGIVLGAAIVVVLSTAILMLSRGVWVLPY
jgi:hypothetical protein